MYREKVALFPTSYLVGQAIPCESEKDVFDALGLPYKAPHERNVFNIPSAFEMDLEA